METKDRNTQESVLSFLMSVLVFQVSVLPEMATVLKVNVHPDNLTTAVLAQKAIALRVTMSRVLRAITMLAHRATMTTTISNPAPMPT